MRTLNREANVGESVKILFYGQSITAQSWTLEVAEILKARFPESQSNMVFVNNAIGGYQADKLSRIANARLYPEYPDLVVFHDYGKLEFIEEMIRRLRTETTAEIVMWTPHVRVSGEGMKRWKEEHVTFGFDDDRRAQGIRRIAKEYDCMLIDVRRMWKSHLAETGEDPQDYLKDVIHPNLKGCKLLVRFIGRELIRTREFGESRLGRNITRVPISKLRTQKGGAVRLEFKGNRVVLVADGKNMSQPLGVSVDGRELSSFPEMYTYTPMKPNLRTLLRVGIGDDPVPEERWTITLLKNASSKESNWSLPFKLHGSVTGNDGEGDINRDFVSTSGRIRIESVDWMRGLGQSFLFRTNKVPRRLASLRFRVVPMFNAKPVPGKKGQQCVLVQGLTNDEHTLIITPAKDGSLGISMLKVYCPG